MRRTVALLDVVSGGSVLVRTGDSRDLKHLHRTVEHAVHDLEAGCLVTPNGSCVAHVLRLPFLLLVLEDDVRRLEYTDGQRM